MDGVKRPHAIILITAAVSIMFTSLLPVSPASANDPHATPSCAGIEFDMPSGLAGTWVTVSANGVWQTTRPVGDVNGALAFDVPSPDQTVAQAWRVFVDAPVGNEDVVIDAIYPACVEPENSLPTTTTSTTAPATASTVADSTTTTTSTSPVVTSTVPVPSSTIVKVGRDVTGQTGIAAVLLVIGLCAVTAVAVTRRRTL